MSETIEREIERGLEAMRKEIGIVPPTPTNVVPFPILRSKLSPLSDPYGRIADSVLAIEALADLMENIALQARRGNADRQKIIEMLETGVSAGRSAAQRLEGQP